MRLSPKLAVLVVLASFFLIAGCHDPTREARGVTHQFIEASERGDTRTAQSLLTYKAREYFPVSDQETATKAVTLHYQVGDPVIRDNEAIVPVTVTDDSGTQERKVQLRREEGKWRVYAMQIPTYAGGPNLTLNYEDPMRMIPESMHAAGVIFGQATRGFEQGMKEFARGFEEGVKSSNRHAATPPHATFEEVNRPSPSPTP